MKAKNGFTVIELLIVIALLIIGSIVFYTQKDQLDATERDSKRKIAINAMYYNLEEVYFEKHSNYPRNIDSKTLRAMDPGLFTDPRGISLNDGKSDYRYEATNCTNDGCKSYTLRADLEREDDFIKTSRNK